MAFDQFTYKRIETLTDEFIQKRRPPVDIRDQVDLSFRIDDQSVVIFEIRPLWDNPAEKIEGMIAKSTFVKSKKVWNIYWQRSDLKWHRYDLDSEVERFEEFLEVVDKDECCSFWG
jgi:hypothetical protein